MRARSLRMSRSGSRSADSLGGARHGEGHTGCAKGSPEWSADARTTSASYVAASNTCRCVIAPLSSHSHTTRSPSRAIRIETPPQPTGRLPRTGRARPTSQDVSHREIYHPGVYLRCRTSPWRPSPRLQVLVIALRGMVRYVNFRGNLCGISRVRARGFGVLAQGASRSRRARTARPDRTGSIHSQQQHHP